jgi:hypothetical protein
VSVAPAHQGFQIVQGNPVGHAHKLMGNRHADLFGVSPGRNVKLRQIVRSYRMLTLRPTWRQSSVATYTVPNFVMPSLRTVACRSPCKAPGVVLRGTAFA